MSDSTRIVINGRFLARSTTGVDRYAREIVNALDSIVEPGFATIAVPAFSQVKEPLELSNISITSCGTHSGHAWEQVDLARFCRRYGATCVSLCNSAPIFNTGIVCIHDVNAIVNPSNFNWKFDAWYRFMNSRITRNASAIITVSEFSKREISRLYPCAAGKIVVAPPAWQHMNRVRVDQNALTNYGLRRRGYWFAMSSLAANKNLKWLVETALLNPGETIVIAGGLNSKVFADSGIPESENVKYLGYVTDEEAKALMEGCKGFLFPTFYEGFGLPPMEALSVGAPLAVVSDTDVMHEVYGEAVAYVDPSKPFERLDSLSRCRPSSNSLLDRYSWMSSAEDVLSLMRSVAGSAD